ncbi:IclR family transcriptional regulator [Dichotomicrobium thermohalophilum]|uniref:IclR family transcriptional regulator n=2 Tax=Dichotomicrobium thermohalophilum TaxID=933063 RepID=A0A397PIV0_9HYPH|nr:IclR family transcriptional regulator [Dichotomicrobium thermohalophilum]
MDRTPEKDGEHVPTGVRSLYILEALARAGTPLTPTDINETLGLPKPTIHRLCKRLEHEGFLEKDLDGRRYLPGKRLRTVARDVLGFNRFLQARQAVLRRLSERVGETCNITLPEEGGMVYLERIETRWPLRVQLPVGSLVPFHCTASGKLYLSSLPPARRENLVRTLDLTAHAPNTITDPEELLTALEAVAQTEIGTDKEEFVEGMVAVAVPILDDSERLVATLAMHGPTQRMSLDDALALIDPLREAASELCGLMPADDADRGHGSAA